MIALILFLSALGAQAQQTINLNDLAVQLEADRLRSAAGLEQYPGGYVTHFFDITMPLVRNSDISFADIERALREQNTGLFLIAAPKSAVDQPTSNGTMLCLKAIKSEETPMEYWIYLAGRGPNQARQKKAEFGITDETTNLEHLKNVGALTLCGQRS